MPAILLKAAPYIAAFAIAFLALFGAYRHGYSTADTEWQSKWNAQAAQLAEAKANAERVQRDEEQRRIAAINEVTTDARKQIDQANADAAAARAGADSLREQARRVASRGSQACGNPGAASGGQAANDPALVLADLFARADARAADLAAYSDRLRAAGAACERAYDAISAGK